MNLIAHNVQMRIHTDLHLVHYVIIVLKYLLFKLYEFA